MKNCKWDEKSRCSFAETFNREPKNEDCAVCVALSMRTLANTFAAHLANVGVGEGGVGFVEDVKTLQKLEDTLIKLATVMYPEFVERRTKELKDEIEGFIKKMSGVV